MRATIVASAVFASLLAVSARAQEPGDQDVTDLEEAVLEGQPAAQGAADVAGLLKEAHAQGKRDHVLEIFRVDSAIESLNDGTVQVFGTRRAIRCPTGELVSESACNPCSHGIAEWGSRPTGVWLYEIGWNDGDEAGHEVALARLEHFRESFELLPRGGAEAGSHRSSFFEYTGRTKAPPEPARATRVRFFVEGREATAAVIPAGARSIEIEARAQGKAGSGTLADLPEARISFSSSCGEIRQAGQGRALFSLAPMVARCEVKAAASPGDAVAALGVTRAVEVEITYEGQAADRILLDGTNVAVLGLRAIAAGQEIAIAPEWKARGATVELLEGGKAIKLRLDKGANEAEVTLLDRGSGAGDSVKVERKKIE